MKLSSFFNFTFVLLMVLVLLGGEPSFNSLMAILDNVGVIFVNAFNSFMNSAVSVADMIDSLFELPPVQ